MKFVLTLPWVGTRELIYSRASRLLHIYSYFVGQENKTKSVRAKFEKTGGKWKLIHVWRRRRCDYVSALSVQQLEQKVFCASSPDIHTGDKPTGWLLTRKEREAPAHICSHGWVLMLLLCPNQYHIFAEEKTFRQTHTRASYIYIFTLTQPYQLHTLAGCWPWEI